MIKHFVPLAVAAFLAAGDWVITNGGERVCQIKTPLFATMVPPADFCENWQPGFTHTRIGMSWPYREGWVRNVGTGGIQFHTESGWKP